MHKASQDVWLIARPPLPSNEFPSVSRKPRPHLLYACLGGAILLTGARAARAEEPTASHAGSPSEATPVSKPPEAMTGWAGVGAGIGFSLAATGLVEAIATDAIQSNGGDGRALGGVTILTFIAAVPIVAISRGSTSGHGSSALRIAGYASTGIALAIGGYLLGTSLGNGARYPTGVVSGLGIAGAAGISLLSTDALMARSDARGVTPTVSVLPNGAGGVDGALGFACTF